MRLFGRQRIYVGPITFNLHLLGLIAEAAKFAEEKVDGFSLVAADGFDVNQLARQRDCVHCRRINYRVVARRRVAIVYSETCDCTELNHPVILSRWSRW